MSTTTSPAPVTPPPRLGALPHVEGPGPTQVERADRWRTVLRWVGDGLCVALLLGMLWWLSWHDGGRAWTPRAELGLLALPVVPFAVAELRRWPRSARWLVLLWYAGVLSSVAFAEDRTDFAHALVSFSLIPVVGLAAHRVWRRPWGPVAMFAVLLVGFGQYWYRSFMQWWGHAMSEGVAPQWRSLSWHNQSGTLMGAFGLLFSGIALSGRKSLSWAAGISAAAAFAGVWLSTSRGALAATAVGLAVVLLGAARRRGWLRVTGITAVLLVVAIGISTAVLSLGSSGVRGAEGVQGAPAESMTQREQTAGTSFLLRLNHWESAFGMFADEPVTGQGLGSYRRMSLPFTPPDGELTVSPHNIYLRVLGEGGLALALPFLALATVGVVLVARRISLARLAPHVTSEDVVPDDVRWPLSLGAAGTATMLLIHQGADFDWDWPVLPALLAVALGILVRDVRTLRGFPDRDDRTAAPHPVLTGALIAVVLVAGIGATFWGNRSREAQGDLEPEAYAAVPVSWSSGHAMAVADDLREGGQDELALGLLDRAIAWNPGLHELRVDRGIILHDRSELTDQELVDLALEEPTNLRGLNEVAQQLIDSGSHGLADTVLRSLLEVYPTYERWGIDGTRSDTWYLRVRAAAEAAGCPAARAVAADARTARGMDEPAELEPIGALVAGTCAQ